MSKFERVVVADSTASPDCRRSAEMDLIAIVSSPGGDSEVRIFRCPECNHELRLTVWHNDLSPANIGGLLTRFARAGWGFPLAARNLTINREAGHCVRSGHPYWRSWAPYDFDLASSPTF